MKVRERLDGNARAGLTAPFVLAALAAALGSGACRSPETTVDPATIPDPVDESLTEAERDRNARFEDLMRTRYRGTPVEASSR